MFEKSNLRLLKIIIPILLSVIVIVISSCNSANKQEVITKLDVSVTAEVAVQATETLSVVEATATPEPTVTATPEPTATATPEPTPTENPYENIGKFPLTLEREDIEENGLIIPFNPVDNPEEFMEYVRGIERKVGYLGLIKDLGGGGTDPVNNIVIVYGEIARYFQVMFFEYEGKYFPVIKPWSSRGTLQDFVLYADARRYGELSQYNVVDTKITFRIYRDIEKTTPGNIASQELMDLAKESGIAVAFFREYDK
jgi:hypothetical protein